MFRTEIPLAPDPRQLARTARVLTLGSCFADSIGSRLAAHKVTALVNPFGTVFNPLSAATLLRAAAGEPVDWAQHLVEARGRWQSYDLHGSIGAESAEALLARIQELVRQAAEFARSADLLVLTLGTAWAYRLRETGELVSNCHKLPATLFEKELLTAEDIVGQLAEAHALLRRLNPKLRMVLTVSPVRHLRDTLPLNSVSKSVLRLASHYLSELLPEVSYFPAYELLTDDLRDYRFYAADMLHPSAVAEDYIWERFARTYFDAEFGRFRKEWEGIQQALAHRPLHAGAPEHRQFLESTLEKLRRLGGQQVDVRAETRDVERRLLALPPPPRPRPVPATVPEEDDEERIDVGQSDGGQSREPAAEVVAAEVEPAPATGPDEVGAAPPAGSAVEVRREGRPGRDRGRPNRRSQDQNKQAVHPVLAEAQALPAAEATTAVPLPPKPSYTDFLVSSAPELLTIAPVQPPAGPSGPEPAASESAATSAAEPAKKKKRRSRGGAKRTARKNAARLAAEQPSGEPASESLPPALPSAPIEVVLPDSGLAPVAPPLVPELDELVAGSPDQAAPVTQPAPAADTAPGAEEPVASEPAVLGTATAAVPKPAATRKRGTAAAAKKSKVITKSAPVKRATRRPPAPAAALAPASKAAAEAAATPEPGGPPKEAATNPPTEVAPSVAPTPPDAATQKPARRPAAKRSSAAKPGPAKAAAKTPSKPAAAASRAKKPTPKAAPAPTSDRTESAGDPAAPASAGPAAAEADGAAPARRRGRPPGTRKVRPNEPDAA